MATRMSTAKQAKSTKATKSVPAPQRSTKAKVATAKSPKAPKEKQVSCIDAAAQIADAIIIATVVRRSAMVRDGNLVMTGPLSAQSRRRTAGRERRGDA